MFKNYLELNQSELEKFIEFINRKNENKLSPEEIDRQFKSEEYDFGRGIIINFKEENIAGKAQIILKECIKRGIAYIIYLDINEDMGSPTSIAAEIIEEAKSIAVKSGAKKAYLGVRDKKIIGILNSLNLYSQYSALKMTLKDRKIRHIPLELIPLSEKNKNEYLKIYNDAFGDIPNGATLTESEVDSYIKCPSEGSYYFIAVADADMIGVLEFQIEKGEGQFDLGLIKAMRGKGYGRRLLETAINFLNSKEVDKINLIVITKNELAYEMYKRRGFEKSTLISDWFELF